MSNIVANILNYVKHTWANNDQNIVKAENINAWELALDNHTQFLKRFSWQPNTYYPKGSVILYPFGLHTKLVSLNAGTSSSREPSWEDASGIIGQRKVNDNGIIWKEAPMQLTADITPIGTIKQQLWHTAPPGYQKLDTSVLLNRSEYPELWSIVQKYMPLTSESNWNRLASSQSSVPYFSEGNGSTTFRTPLLMDFARAGKTTEIAQFHTSQNKSHTHTRGTMEITGNTAVSNDFQYYPGVFDGAFTYEGQRSDAWCANDRDGRSVSKISFRASKTWTGNTSYEGGSEAFPTHFIMPYFLRTKML